MSNGGAESASGIATYRTARELGSRSPRSYAAVREPNELVVIHRFTRCTDPRAKSTASFVSPDGGVSLASDAMASLARDARCLAKNWHPNIARVRHVDVEGDDLTVATELVDGATLGDLFAAAAAAAAQRARGASGASAEPLLPLPVLVRILVDVVTGLSGLHGLRDDKGAPLGAIHGALSPANIVVGKDGVARLLNALRPRPLRIAGGTEAVGYAAPEALDLGATQDVRADLHSVGVIMWEGLTGRRLYEETDPTRVLARQREEDVSPPAFPAGSPFARLADVTMRALAFDPSLRFKTAAEMGAALRNIAATRIATGSVVATQVAELTGDRIRARRNELDPSTTGKRRLTSDRNLRAAKPASPTATPAAPATATAASASASPSDSVANADHDTLPPGAMDPADLGPPSSIPRDLSVRDFLEPAASAPPLAPAPAPAPAPPKKTLVGQAAPVPAATPAIAAPKPAPPKPAPPLVRKTANAASSASMRVATPAPSPSQTTDRGLGPPAPAPPPPVVKESAPAIAIAAPAPTPRLPPVVPNVPTVVVDLPAEAEQLPAPAPAPAPVATATAPLYIASPNQASQAARAPSPPPTSVFDDVPAPAPPVAYAPVVRSTPDGAFTPTSITPPRDRRAAVAVLLGCALALLLVVGFFAMRAMVAGPGTKTTAGTTSTTTAATTAPTGEPTATAEAKPETPPAATATATATAEATNEATPAATTEAAPTAPATAAATDPAPDAPAAPAVARPQSSGAPRPKRPTYEPLGI